MKRFLLVAACLICALAIASPASAVLIGSNELVGGKNDSSPADLTSITGYAEAVVIWYNGGTNPDADYFLDPPLPAAPIPALDTLSGVKTDTSIWNVPTIGYQYLWAKLGSHGALYYIGDLTENVTGLSSIPSQFTGPPGVGLSSITLFNKVPEPGTVMLLGLGLAGVATFRRFKKL